MSRPSTVTSPWRSEAAPAASTRPVLPRNSPNFVSLPCVAAVSLLEQRLTTKIPGNRRVPVQFLGFRTDIPDDLIRAQLAGEVVFVVGAGVSKRVWFSCA